MRVPRSVLVLRGCCLLALLASAALTADSLHVGRQFCPLDAACAKARDSALGSFFGIKTSVLGIAAFAGLFLLTLLPLSFARKVARPAAWAAGLAGLAFVVYQGIVLGTFCPFCLVADLCGLGAAAAAFAWPPPLLYRGRGKKKPSAVESVPARLRWALAAQAIVALPLLWPTPPAKPNWVELPAETVASIDVAAEFAPFLAERKGPPADERPAPPPAPAPEEPPAPAPRAELPDVVADAVPMPDPTPAPRPAPVRAEPPPAPRPDPVRAEPPTAVIAPPRPTVREIVVLEYLNAFCSHCRATHARLDRVVAGFGRPVRRHRVYVWSSREVPLWAKACAVAAQQGREDAMFDALLETDRQDDRSIRAAAARAGVDLSDLDAPEVANRLERDRRLFSQARLEGLPTFDVGRRRLMGEQSEGELLEALRAAAGG
ncbi:MAG: DsbA family protein [Planctomycetia bacterium]|nr:DsbA family protein [Planctomycetia bacterium]